ncbi:MAG TPA: MFS transporter, partial [Burkholderiales bacterium]|nr:MFS transporter [Burkholderiales bacterium]
MTAPLRLSAYFGAYFLYAGAFMPYFTLYLAARGLDAAAIALVMAMPQLARIAAPSFWGWLADRSGRGRVIVIGSSGVLVAGYAALASLEQAAAIAGVVLAMSLLTAGALPIVEAITMSTLEGRVERYGPVRLWGSVGFVAGVMGTGLWLDTHAPQSLIGVLVVLTALTLGVSFLVPPARAARGATLAEASVAEVLRRPEV